MHCMFVGNFSEKGIFLSVFPYIWHGSYYHVSSNHPKPLYPRSLNYMRTARVKESIHQGHQTLGLVGRLSLTLDAEDVTADELASVYGRKKQGSMMKLDPGACGDMAPVLGKALGLSMQLVRESAQKLDLRSIEVETDPVAANCEIELRAASEINSEVVSILVTGWLRGKDVLRFRAVFRPSINWNLSKEVWCEVAEAAQAKSFYSEYDQGLRVMPCATSHSWLLVCLFDQRWRDQSNLLICTTSWSVHSIYIILHHSTVLEQAYLDESATLLACHLRRPLGSIVTLSDALCCNATCETTLNSSAKRIVAHASTSCGQPLQQQLAASVWSSDVNFTIVLNLESFWSVSNAAWTRIYFWISGSCQLSKRSD